MDLAHGTDSNATYPFDKAEASNRSFVKVFEELLYELWRAIENSATSSPATRPTTTASTGSPSSSASCSGPGGTSAVLGREELAATTAMGWVELTLSSNTSVVTDLRAEATSSSDRLRVIGERVRLMPHTRATSLFSMATELSVLLRALEAGWVSGSGQAWLLYQNTAPGWRPAAAGGTTTARRRGQARHHRVGGSVRSRP